MKEHNAGMQDHDFVAQADLQQVQLLLLFHKDFSQSPIQEKESRVKQRIDNKERIKKKEKKNMQKQRAVNQKIKNRSVANKPFFPNL